MLKRIAKHPDARRAGGHKPRAGAASILFLSTKARTNSERAASVPTRLFGVRIEFGLLLLQRLLLHRHVHDRRRLALVQLVGKRVVVTSKRAPAVRRFKIFGFLGKLVATRRLSAIVRRTDHSLPPFGTAQWQKPAGRLKSSTMEPPSSLYPCRSANTPVASLQQPSKSV